MLLVDVAWFVLFDRDWVSYGSETGAAFHGPRAALGAAHYKPAARRDASQRERQKGYAPRWLTVHPAARRPETVG
jgi:hypothetical protein